MSKLKLYGYLGVIILVVGLMVWGQMSGLRLKVLATENQGLTLALSQARAEATAVKTRLAASYEALASRETALTEMNQETERLKDELEELYKTNEPCGTWADGPVPGPVLERLRR